MAQAELVAKRRETTGKGPARRMRRDGWIPAVFYGHGEPGELLAVEKQPLERVLGAGSHVVGIRDPGGDLRRALIREVQVEPVTQEVLHVDFQEVSEHETIEISARLVVRGEAAGTKEGGVLDVRLYRVEIECPVDSAVDEIRVDVSGLGLGQTLHVEELSIPPGVKVVTPGSQVVASVRIPKEVVEEEVAAADTEVAAQPEVITERKREERAKEREEG